MIEFDPSDPGKDIAVILADDPMSLVKLLKDMNRKIILLDNFFEYRNGVGVLVRDDNKIKPKKGDK